MADWLKFQCRDPSREVGKSRRGLRRLELHAGRVKFVLNGYWSVY